MRRLLCFALILPSSVGVFRAQNAGGRPIHNEVDRLARWKPVEMPFHGETLSARERAMIAKLVEACQLLDSVYWRQSDYGGLQVYKATRDATMKSLLGVMGGRWDLLDANHFFLGEMPMPPGREWYPHDLTRAGLEDYVRAHPEQRAAIYDPYTVVRRQGTRLVTEPYHEAYRPLLVPMAKALRDAATLSDDAGFATFLRLRAEALLTDDYYKSDLAWLDLKNPKFDVIFAPYETYTDGLLGVKTTYGAAILIRDDAETRKLAVFEQYVPQIQDALPVDAAARPSKRGRVTPMEVMDAPYRAGDLYHGYQAVADNLPNDPRIHQEKGSKKIFFKNFGDARVTHVIVPVALKLMPSEQASKVTPDGYFTGSLVHEIAHDLGPEFTTRDNKQVPINEAIGPAYASLEEAKADIVGMFALKWLTDRQALPAARLEEFYCSYLGGLLRSIRFGAGEAHSRAEMMQFNYLQENGAISRDSGLYRVDFSRIPTVIGALARELLQLEAAGDRAGTEAFFEKYGRMPADLKTALAATADIPVDIRPLFSFPEKLQ